MASCEGDFEVTFEFSGDSMSEETLPAFVHEYGEANYSLNRLNHEYRGSFLRHIAVERVLLFLRCKVLCEWIGDACPLHEILDALVGIGFGLNCNFPHKDVALYTVWRLRGCRLEIEKEAV